MLAWVTRLSGVLAEYTHGAGYNLSLLAHATLQAPSLRWRRQIASTLRQMYACGVLSIPVTFVVSVFTGAIVAMNTGLALQQIGQEGLIGRIVAISITREMGPFMTALTLAASVGSAMAAELGTMKVSEEVEALEVMGIDPARFLVLPRLVAMALMTPVLTIYVVTVGILGAAVLSHYQFGVSFLLFQSDALNYLSAKDVYTALLKAFIFGVVIATVGCAQGLRASGGAIGVGQATRHSVVITFLLIIVLGYYVTYLFFLLEW
jgi:phospholipid/cholesterol/gamma-HCH transport system permease protein